MNQSNKLTLEQEFKLTIYKQKINKINNIDLKKHIIYLLKLMMIKDNLIKYFIKKEII
uniref:phycobilisome degradation protein n=1 Tax=Campylaephora boydenii TaxID=202204 RepID=UPI002551FBDC|nr:phycobilisome degradation protein [Campylaephora boydenii]WGT74210.1 phycobilisome degradation protein [Campylaephora boydenii]